MKPILETPKIELKSLAQAIIRITFQMLEGKITRAETQCLTILGIRETNQFHRVLAQVEPTFRCSR